MLSLTSLFPRQRAVRPIPTMISLESLTPVEREWFYLFKWERPASPATMQHMMAQAFGAQRAEELVVFFEKTAIPARPGEWRRRNH